MSEMKLADAIRLGGMATKQGYGVASFLDDNTPCALGAVRLAAGIEATNDLGAAMALRSRFPILSSSHRCPACGAVEPLFTLIWSLNDSHKWTRERIADFVETIERRAVAERQPETETVATAVSLVAQK